MISWGIYIYKMATFLQGQPVLTHFCDCLLVITGPQSNGKEMRKYREFKHFMISIGSIRTRQSKDPIKWEHLEEYLLCRVPSNRDDHCVWCGRTLQNKVTESPISLWQQTSFCNPRRSHLKSHRQYREAKLEVLLNLAEMTQLKSAVTFCWYSITGAQRRFSPLFCSSLRTEPLLLEDQSCFLSSSSPRTLKPGCQVTAHQSERRREWLTAGPCTLCSGCKSYHFF